MHPERPPKHHILHIFNAFIIFYYPTPSPHHPHFCDHVNDDDAMPPQGIPPQMARACAKKGVGEVTPPSVIPPHNTTQNCGTIIRFDGDGARKLPPWGLYFRKGRVDERSEIYPVWRRLPQNPTPLGVVLSLIPHTMPPSSPFL